MSVDIFLVKFTLDSSGAYVDTESDLIESVTIPSDLFHELRTRRPGAKSSLLQVFEHEDKQASFEIDCYLPDDASTLRDDLRAVFLQKLRKFAVDTGSASVDQLKTGLVDSILGTFKSLTNLDALLTRKLEGFRDDDSVVVRVNANE